MQVNSPKGKEKLPKIKKPLSRDDEKQDLAYFQLSDDQGDESPRKGSQARNGRHAGKAAPTERSRPAVDQGSRNRSKTGSPVHPTRIAARKETGAEPAPAVKKPISSGIAHVNPAASGREESYDRTKPHAGQDGADRKSVACGADQPLTPV